MKKFDFYRYSQKNNGYSVFEGYIDGEVVIHKTVRTDDDEALTEAFDVFEKCCNYGYMSID